MKTYDLTQSDKVNKTRLIYVVAACKTSTDILDMFIQKLSPIVLLPVSLHRTEFIF